MSRETLAEKTGYHWTTVGRIENGEIIMSVVQLETFAQALGVNVPWLYMDIAPRNASR